MSTAILTRPTPRALASRGKTSASGGNPANLAPGATKSATAPSSFSGYNVLLTVPSAPTLSTNVRPNGVGDDLHPMAPLPVRPLEVTDEQLRRYVFDHLDTDNHGMARSIAEEVRRRTPVYRGEEHVYRVARSVIRERISPTRYLDYFDDEQQTSPPARTRPATASIAA